MMDNAAETPSVECGLCGKPYRRERPVLQMRHVVRDDGSVALEQVAAEPLWYPRCKHGVDHALVRDDPTVPQGETE